MSAADLVQVFAKVQFPTRSDVLVGPETFDDAGVMDLGGGRALLHTVDFFPPIVDDPYQFGRVAAANALSDVYAMGGTPICTLNIVAFPLQELGADVLGDMLAGGAAVIADAGAALLGGHSVKDSEVKYGLAVTGIASIEQLTTNRGARPGDRLVLTKPLGMGAISTAIKQELAPRACVDSAVEIMATLNKGAAEAMRGLPVHAATDITGFGLAGHTAEMARGADVSIRLFARELPVAPGALELVEKGLFSSAVRKNRSSLGATLSVAANVEPAMTAVALDAETSGGLLLAVAPEACDDLVAALSARQAPCAAVVGEVTAREAEILVTLE